MVTFPGNRELPSLGLGTWRMGEVAARRKRDVAAVRAAIDMGWRVIDTAEMYGEGGAEKVVADAIEGQRDLLFIVTKAYPHNASRRELPKACERSLKRTRVQSISN